MAGTPTKAVAPSGALDPSEVTDTADTTTRAPAPQTKGRRVRAIPGAGGTTVRMYPVDWNRLGIPHSLVEWDFRKDNFTVAVGEGKNQVHEDAAEYLCKNFPLSFEFMGE